MAKMLPREIEVNEKFNVGEELAKRLKAARERVEKARHEPSRGNL